MRSTAACSAQSHRMIALWSEKFNTRLWTRLELCVRRRSFSLPAAALQVSKLDWMRRPLWHKQCEIGGDWGTTPVCLRSGVLDNAGLGSSRPPSSRAPCRCDSEYLLWRGDPLSDDRPRLFERPRGSRKHHGAQRNGLWPETAKQSRKTVLDILERYVQGNMALSDAIWRVSTPF